MAAVQWAQRLRLDHFATHALAYPAATAPARSHFFHLAASKRFFCEKDVLL